MRLGFFKSPEAKKTPVSQGSSGGRPSSRRGSTLNPFPHTYVQPKLLHFKVEKTTSPSTLFGKRFQGGRFLSSQHSCMVADGSFSLGFTGYSDWIQASVELNLSPSSHIHSVLSTYCPSTCSSALDFKVETIHTGIIWTSIAELLKP